jgi:hypothetical protein
MPARGWDGASSSLYVAPQPAHEHPHRTQPSMAVLHPVDARHRALGGAMVPTILSERSSKFGDFLNQTPTPYMQPGAPHSSLGMYLEMTQQASLLQPACCTCWT